MSVNKNSNGIIVCISAAPSSKRVIQYGAEMAKALNTQWIGLYIQTAAHHKLSDREKRTLQNNLNLAGYLGGDLLTVKGTSIADDIARYARSRNITTLVVGKNPRSHILRLLSLQKDTFSQIMKKYPFFNVYVVPGNPQDYAGYKALQKKRSTPEKQQFSLQSILISLGVLSLTFGVGFFFYSAGFKDANIVMIFILAVLFVSISAGRILGLAASVLSVLMFNFLFTEPRFTFVVYDTQYLLTFPVMLIVSLTASELTVRMKRETINAAVRERRTEFLYNVSRQILKTIGKEEVIITVIDFLENFINCSFVCFLSENDGMVKPFYPQNQISTLSETELSVIQWVYSQSISAGRGTDIMPDRQGFYVPLSSRESNFGVLGVLSKNHQNDLDPNQRSLIEAVAAQLAVALDRERLYKEQEEIRIEIEREKMHSNLLRSISHDLRTPLAAIAGASSTILSGNMNINRKDTKRLLNDIVNDATWLTQLVENLLSLTRAEEGQLGVSREWEVVEEVVLSVIERMRKRDINHEIKAILPDEPFMAYMDTGLIQQVIINLLDNAVRYTPKSSTITIRIGKTSTSIYIEVEDNGPGIPASAISTIFERFMTVRKNKSQERRGLGLGLAICRSIVEAHEGSIDAENVFPHGAKFRITLPDKNHSNRVS